MKLFFYGAAWLLLLVLGGCAGGPQRSSGQTASNESRALTASDLVLSERMAAEFALQQGDGEAHLLHLVKAAEASDDPVQAKTALRAALAVSNQRLAEAMLARFTRLAADSSEPRAWAIALALDMGRSEEAWRLAGPDAGAKIENRQLGEALAAVPVRERILPFIERTIETSADLSTALRWCSFVHRLNESDLALILVSGLVDRFPQQSSALAWRAQLKRDMKDNEGALADFHAALVLDPESRFLRLSIAQLEDAAGDPAAAARRVAEIRPADDLVVQAQVAYAARSQNPVLLQDAYAALQSLPEPRPPLRLQMLGTVAETLGKPGEAIAWLRAVPAGPEQAESWLRASVLLNQAGDTEDALELLRSVRGLAGVEREALVSSYLIEGSLLSRAGEAAAARALYSAALTLLPDEPQLLYARALEHAELEDTAAAETDLRRVLAIDPEHADAMNALGYTLADRTDRLTEALALIQAALKLRPDDGAMLDSLGWVTYRMGKPGEAVEILRAAHALVKDVDVAAHLGEALWANDQRDEARRIWSEARNLDPGNPVLLDTLRRHGL